DLQDRFAAGDGVLVAGGLALGLGIDETVITPARGWARRGLLPGGLGGRGDGRGGLALRFHGAQESRVRHPSRRRARTATLGLARRRHPSRGSPRGRPRTLAALAGRGLATAPSGR